MSPELGSNNPQSDHFYPSKTSIKNSIDFDYKAVEIFMKKALPFATRIKEGF